MDFFTEKELSALTELEYEVYKYIINNSDKIPYMTIRELSAEAHVSSTTIVNFCKKLNCNGFSEFKIKYKMSQKDTAPVIHSNSSLDNFWVRAKTKEFNDTLDEVSAEINKSSNLIAIGFGKSGVMAKYASTYFTSLGKLCLSLDSPYLELGHVNMSNCTALLFSVKGEYPNYTGIINNLIKSNVTIVSITNNGNNSLAKLSNYNIPYHIQYESIGGNIHMDITTQVPVIYIIECLAKRSYNISANKIEMPRNLN